MKETVKMRFRKKTGYLAYFIHNTIEEWMQNEKIYLGATALLSFLYVLGIILYAWPISSILGFCYFLVFLITGLAIIILLTKFLIVCVFMLILGILKPVACNYYKQCRASIKPEANGKGISIGQDAKVGLKYFINLEKDRSLFHAEYLGPV